MSIYFLLLLWFSVVQSVPVWESASGQYTINALVPFATEVTAKGVGFREAVTKYLALTSPGHFGNLTVSPRVPSPPLFYVRNEQLYHYANESSIFPVNLINTTTVAPRTDAVPLQLVVDKTRAGVTNGVWRWRGTILHYDFGGRTNGGVYYLCRTEEGGSKLLLFLKGVATPSGCEFVTLHSFVRD